MKSHMFVILRVVISLFLKLLILKSIRSYILDSKDFLANSVKSNFKQILT